MADGSIRVDVKLASKELKGGLKDIQNMVSSSAESIKKSFNSIDESAGLKNMTASIKKGMSETEKQIMSLQKQLDNVDTNKSIKAVQKMIDTANKEIDKAKSKVDEYQKKLDSIDAQKETISLQATKDSRIGMNDTDENIERRVQRLLDENKEYQKLLAQEQQMVDKIKQYETNISSAESKVRILSQTLENAKSNMSFDLSEGIGNASQQMNEFNSELERTNQLQEGLNQVNEVLADEKYLSKIQNEEQYNQELENTLNQMKLIEEASENVSNSSAVDYDSLISGNQQYQEMYHQLMLLINNQDRFTQSVSFTSAMTNALKEKFPRITAAVTGMKSAFDGVKEKVSKIGHYFSPITKKISSIKDKISSLIPHFKKASTSSKSFGDTVSNSAEKGIKKLAKMGLAVLGLRSAFMGVRKAINMALEDNQKAQDTIATFWQGIANLIQPVITIVVNGLGTIMNYINSIYKMFTGKDLFKPVSAEASKAADSTKKLADNAKEAKRQLAGFDEMQVLSSNNDSSNNDSKGTAASQFTTESFDVSAVKLKLEELFEPMKNAWDKYGKGFTDSFKYALTEVWELVKSIGKSFEEVWTNGTGELTCSLILQILTNVFNIIGDFAKGFREAWDTAGLGTSIIQDLWDIFNDVLKVIESITRGIDELIKQTDFTPLLKGIKSVTGLLKDLADIIADTVDKIINNLVNGDFTGAGKALSDGLDSMIVTVKNWIDGIDWKGIGEGLGNITNAFIDFFSGIDWMQLADDAHDAIISAVEGIVDMIGSWVTTVDWGKLLMSALTAICAAIKGAATTIWDAIFIVLESLLDGIVDWAVGIGENIVSGLTEGLKAIGTAIVDLFDSAIEAVKDFLGIHSPSTVFKDIGKNILEGIKNGLNGLAEWFKNIFNEAWKAVKNIFKLDTVKTFFSGVWSGIKTVFNTVGTWFKNIFSTAWTGIKNIFKWETVKNFFSNIWSGIRNIFSSVGSWFKNIFNNAWTGIKNVFSLKSVKNFFSNIWSGIKNVFSSVKTWFKSLFSGAWSNIKNAFSLKTIKKFFSNIWSGIKSAFGSVTSWFKNTFSSAWKAVKNVFSAGGKVFSGIKDGIANVFKSVVNTLISGINKVIAVPFNAINNMLNKIRSTDILGFKPFIDLWKKNPLSVPKIPKLARGGIVNVPTQFIAGEAGKEAVLPLQNNTEWMDMLAGRLVEKMDIKNNQGNMTIILKVGDQEFYRWIVNMQKKNNLILNGG